ncbi:MAG: Sec-independent protein translocase protein TatA [Chloroflexi bacterium]|jgi:Sec-independent protein translocase protein TatA|nr:MAG: Sec-independent protein translocase protein TatA [Chloroflexota bacterium]
MNFLGMGSLEILTVFIIAFIILGPTKMIGMGKEIGKFVRDARKMGSDLQNSITDGITDGNENPIESLRSLINLDEIDVEDQPENPASLLSKPDPIKSDKANENEKD